LIEYAQAPGKMGQFSALFHQLNITKQAYQSFELHKVLDFGNNLQLRLLLRRIHQTLPPAKAEQIRRNLAHLDLFTALGNPVPTMVSPDVLEWVMP
jgi:hypothetical protein